MSELEVDVAILGGGLAGLTCDLRIVVIDGEARHAVVRTSRSPLTNLHLGNPRGDLDAFQEMVGEAGWEQVCAAARAAAGAFPGALYAGVDVAVARGLRRVAVLEINAFGDLLPRVEWEGKDTYMAEVEAALDRGGPR